MCSIDLDFSQSKMKQRVAARDVLGRDYLFISQVISLGRFDIKKALLLSLLHRQLNNYEVRYLFSNKKKY